MSVRPIALIANGSEPNTGPERAALAACFGCVCCDRLPPIGAPPLLQIVGDLDSLDVSGVSPGLITDCHEDQESNDLTKGVQWISRHFPQALIHYFAVTGKREDHTLANLALIAAMQRPAQVFSASGWFRVLLAGVHRLTVRPKEAISFLSFVPQRISASGVVWPVERLLLDSLWRATLNRCRGKVVMVRCEAPLLVFQPWKGL